MHPVVLFPPMPHRDAETSDSRLRIARFKDSVRTAAPGAALAWQRLKERWRKTWHHGRDLEVIFTEIYRGNLWGDSHSVSGPGSSLGATENLRRELPLVFAELDIRTLLDAPCGDCHWIMQTPLVLDLYVGCDVVPSLITRNIANHGGPGRVFRTADLTRDRLPATDAILCRDCLIHFSYDYIQKALLNFSKSGAKYLLTTTYSGLAENHDILTGQWRPLDLQLPPFNLPEPLRLITEKEYVEGARQLRRSLGVWRLGCGGSDGSGSTYGR